MGLQENPAYPAAVAKAEQEWITERRGHTFETAPEREPMGIGLSGGGIRSATFCLGVCQGLASHGLLRRADFVSSVSGGGYFASFFGRLFGRKDPATGKPNDIQTVERLLAASPDSPPVRNLRDFGRYMAPTGSGDLLTAIAVILRNGFTIHVVLGVLILAVFMFCIACRNALAYCLPDQSAAPAARLLAVLFVAWTLPCGWAYWIPPRARRGIALPAWGLLILVAVAGLAMYIAMPAGEPHAFAWLMVPIVAALTAAAHAGAKHVACKATSFAVLQLIYRNTISHWLKRSLIAIVAVAAVAVFEGAGRWLCFTVAQEGWGKTLALISAALPAAFAAIQRAKLALAKLVPGAGARSGKKLMLAAAAVGIWALVLTAWSLLAHALAYRFPSGGSVRFSFGSFLGLAPSQTPGGSLLLYQCVLVLALLLLAWIMGNHLGFVNYSSQHALYSARLTRAYLGASNPARAKSGSSLTKPDPDDDTSLSDYWGWGAGTVGKPCSQGAPIHMINATINETVDGRSGIQQLDRKGTSIAVGPCAFSVGIRHHAVPEPPATPGAPSARGGGTRPREVLQCVSPAQPGGYRVFEPGVDGKIVTERLSLGQWVALSGAAFSTGTGSRTSLFMSMLAGFANVRLGYWWRSGVRAPSVVGRWLRLFAVQRQLFDEFSARFPGTARCEWYLSDGGHFENLGAYELLRRQLKRIVLIDAEADPDYRYEGLLLLTRKARIDFGARIHFLDTDELDEMIDEEYRSLFGTLDDLRRSEGRQGTSPAHAALATVDYPGTTPGYLLYIKPTLTGDEEPDVLDYHGVHADFPQQTTADQFFDEAQWESHRALGRHIADKLFRPGPVQPSRWQPANIFT